LGNALHRWLVYLDKDSPAEAVEEAIAMDGTIGKFQSVMDKIRRDPAMRRTYEQYEKAESDWTSGINGAKREGIREGLEKGMQMRNWEIAKELKGIGLPADQIARATGLSVSDIAGL
jgi:predicted transposase/invertase (TIGR01784 family)